MGVGNSSTKRAASGRELPPMPIGSDGISAALHAGVGATEHGDGPMDQFMDEMVGKLVAGKISKLPPSAR